MMVNQDNVWDIEKFLEILLEIEKWEGMPIELHFANPLGIIQN